MRLLTRRDGEIRLTDDLYEHELPPYAVLSHTWGRRQDELTFKDIVDGGGRHKAGFEKITFCAEQAAKDSLNHFWVDSCCIDKSSSSELHEALNSMFRWYQQARKCYVYMEDVSMVDQHDSASWEQAFRSSRWFTRGWTLQELLAPCTVDFYTKEGELLGNKQALETLLHDITGIDTKALQGAPMSQFEVDVRFSWARHRHTTRPEDAAYSLLGVFGIFIPVIYGEGKEHAMDRLRREIHKASGLVKGKIDKAHVVNNASVDPVKASVDPAKASVDPVKAPADPNRPTQNWYGRLMLKNRGVEASAITFAPERKGVKSSKAPGEPKKNMTIAQTWRKSRTQSTSTQPRWAERSLLDGHGSLVKAVAFAPDGTTLATGSWDKTIRLWDTQTGRAIQTLESHSDRVDCIAFSQDGSTLASGSQDRTIKLWDPRSGKVRHTLHGHTDNVEAVVFSPVKDILASASRDSSVKLWDRRAARVIQTIGFEWPTCSVAFSPEGMLAITDPTSAQMWDIESSKSLGTMKTGSPITSMAFSSDTGALLAVSARTAILWDCRSWKKRHVLRGHTRHVNAVAFSPNSTMVASGSDDKTIRLWDAQAGHAIQTLRGHNDCVKAVAFSPKGGTLASGSLDGSVKLWSPTG